MNEIPNLNNKNIVVKIRFDVLRFFLMQDWWNG